MVARYGVEATCSNGHKPLLWPSLFEVAVAVAIIAVLDRRPELT